jgi:environmental stress-induced protein Ves
VARTELIRSTGWRRTRWKNGRGITHEVAIGPGSGAHGFDWRVSVATVTSDGPFSVFEGIDRTTVLLEGEGMELSDAEAGTAVVIERAFQPVRLSAERELECRLLGGEVRDLNVFTDRLRSRHSVATIDVTPRSVEIERNVDVTLAFVLSGPVRATVDGDASELDRYDTLRIDRAVRPIQLTSWEDASCAVIRIAMT